MITILIVKFRLIEYFNSQVLLHMYVINSSWSWPWNEGLAMSISVGARYNLVEVTDDWHCVATLNEERVFFAVIERVMNIYK